MRAYISTLNFIHKRLNFSKCGENNGEGILERVRGIEPPFEAWEAAALPLSYTRIVLEYMQ